jgi:drug/metabolite transporter (DMT)-like permease
MLLVGSYVGLSKGLVGVFPVFLLAWLRFGIAALAMVTWAVRGPGDAPLTARERRLLCGQSVLGNVLFSVCMLYGVSLTSAVSAGVVMAALPATVALLSWGWLGEALRRRVLAGIGCAAAGIALMAWARSAGEGQSQGLGAGSHGRSVLGHALLIGAVVCEASYVVIGKQLVGRVSAKRITAWVNLWGWALMTPLGLWQALHFDFAAVQGGTWGLLVYYALAASVVSVWLWMRGLVQVPAAQAGVFTVLLPVSAAAVGVLWLGEDWGAPHAVALLLALAGVWLASGGSGGTSGGPAGGPTGGVEPVKPPTR